MTIFLGADHAGFRLKEQLKPFLKGLGHDVRDLGSKRLIAGDDYPAFAFAVSRAVARQPKSRGILVCGTGVGMAIVANKVRGIRGVNAWSPTVARRSRQDEDTNVLCLAGWLLAPNAARGIARAWLGTPFSRARRQLRRVAAIGRIDRR